MHTIFWSQHHNNGSPSAGFHTLRTHIRYNGALSAVLLREKDEASLFKQRKDRIIRNLTIEPFIRVGIRKKLSRHPIQKVTCSEHTLTPKYGRHRGEKKKRPYCIEKMTLLAFSTPILRGSARAR